MKADESLEQIFKVQAGKLEESDARLKQVMPSYFFKSVSTEDLAAILPMAAELENKSGIQMIELKSETCNPVCTSRFFAGKRILRSIIHESAPLDGSGGIIVIEQITKDVPTFPHHQIPSVAQNYAPGRILYILLLAGA